MKNEKSDLSMKEVASIVGMHIESIRSLVRQGKIPGVYKIGGRYRISQEALDKFRNKLG